MLLLKTFFSVPAAPWEGLQRIQRFQIKGCNGASWRHLAYLCSLCTVLAEDFRQVLVARQPRDVLWKEQ